MDMLYDGDEGPMLLLAHGAGAPMDSDAMNRITAALVATGFRVGRFEFPYMVNRRQDGRKRPPDGMKTLLRAWRDCIDQVLDACDPGEPLFIGGKSMGGRIATHILAEECPEAVAGAMVFGYPFHPPGKPDRWRIDHFPRLERPLWIAQGERDPFGKYQELADLDLGSAPVQIRWVANGDHDLLPTRRSGLDPDSLLAEAAGAAADFGQQCLEARF
jgi:hypothetical protein